MFQVFIVEYNWYIFKNYSSFQILKKKFIMDMKKLIWLNKKFNWSENAVLICFPARVLFVSSALL